MRWGERVDRVGELEQAGRTQGAEQSGQSAAAACGKNASAEPAAHVDGRRAMALADAARAITEICDADYRCAWRPCEALEERVDREPAPSAVLSPEDAFAEYVADRPPRATARRTWRAVRRRGPPLDAPVPEVTPPEKAP